LARGEVASVGDDISGELAGAGGARDALTSQRWENRDSAAGYRSQTAKVMHPRQAMFSASPNAIRPASNSGGAAASVVLHMRDSHEQGTLLGLAFLLLIAVTVVVAWRRFRR
jgi:hypothetical protein